MDTPKQNRRSLRETLVTSAKAFASALSPPFLATFGKTTSERIRLGLAGLAISFGLPLAIETALNLSAPVYERGGIKVETSYHPPEEIADDLRISTLGSPYEYIWSLLPPETRITDGDGLDATFKGKPIYFDSNYEGGQGAYRINSLESPIINNHSKMGSEETRRRINEVLDTLATSMNSKRWQEQTR